MSKFEIIEKVGVSKQDYTEAVKNALKGIDKKISWFEVVEQRGRLTPDGEIEFQVVIKIGCN
jgi:flavin-binding protein dodecin